MIERSIQAKFIIPMAISLGFGVLFATSITLLLIPCLYMTLEDILSHISRFLNMLSPKSREIDPKEKTL